MVYTLDDGTQRTRRKRVVLTGAVSGVQSNFQIKLAALAHEASMQSGFSDLRFTKADMHTLIDTWLEDETDDTSADIWIEAPTTPANGAKETYWIYYGNAGVVSVWDISATFLFGDDFPGTSIDTNKWTINGSYMSVSSGELHGTRTDSRVVSKTTFSSGVIQESKVRATVLVNTGHMAAGFSPSIGDGIGLMCSSSRTYYYDDGFLEFTPSVIPLATDMRYIVSVTSPTSTNLEIYNINTSTLFHSITGISNVVSNEHVSVGKRYDGLQNNAYSAHWDWIFVRKYVVNPPTAVIGTEERQRRTPMMM